MEPIDEKRIDMDMIMSMTLASTPNRGKVSRELGIERFTDSIREDIDKLLTNSPSPTFFDMETTDLRDQSVSDSLMRWMRVHEEMERKRRIMERYALRTVNPAYYGEIRVGSGLAVTNGTVGEYKEGTNPELTTSNMSQTKFARNEGIANVPKSLGIFLVGYAKERGVPVWSGSDLNDIERDVEGPTMCGINWADDDGLTLSTPTVMLTVQEFMAKCDLYVVAAEVTRTIELGDYSEVVLNGTTGIMTMNEQDITFADIRKVAALAGETSPVDTFIHEEGIRFDVNDKTDTALFHFLLGYAKEKGVTVADNFNEDDTGFYGLVFNVDRDDAEYHGLTDGGPEHEISVQEFMRKCNRFTEAQKYFFKISEDYFADVNHDSKTVDVGCQHIPFAKLPELIALMDELEVAAGKFQL